MRVMVGPIQFMRLRRCCDLTDKEVCWAPGLDLMETGHFKKTQMNFQNVALLLVLTYRLI